jgi:hypothetical protein
VTCVKLTWTLAKLAKVRKTTNIVRAYIFSIFSVLVRILESNIASVMIPFISSFCGCCAHIPGVQKPQFPEKNGFNGDELGVNPCTVTPSCLDKPVWFI